MKNMIKLLGLIFLLIIINTIFKGISDSWVSGYYAGLVSVGIVYLFINIK